MEDFLDFLSAVPNDVFENCNNENQFGRKWDICSENNIPDLANKKIVIIGVPEQRNATINKGSHLAPDSIRRHLYALYPQIADYDVADLGNVVQGNTIKDTFFAVKSIIEYLLKENKTIIILGGSNDIAYAQYLAYQNSEKIINICNVDAYVDFSKNIEEELSNKNYVGKIILHEPGFLFNYAHMAYQSYFVGKDNINFMEELYFEYYRLGTLRGKIENSEPIIRNSDMMIFDMCAVKKFEGGIVEHSSPNGLSADEACQMMWYAGMNDKLSSLGIYEVNPSIDKKQDSSHLAAQMIWSFIEGVYNRKNDMPVKDDEDYLSYKVLMHQGKYEIRFIKSNKTGRWWMEVPYPPQVSMGYERHAMVPCSQEDYETAIKDELPERWWQTYIRFSYL